MRWSNAERAGGGIPASAAAAERVFAGSFINFAGFGERPRDLASFAGVMELSVLRSNILWLERK